jgi:5'-3' exonuclease
MEENKKLNYEQLEQIANQLSQQNREMYSKLQELNRSNALVRLDYLFRVIELAAKYPQVYNQILPDGFVNDCIHEFVESMTIPKEEVVENPKDTTDIENSEVVNNTETPVIDLKPITEVTK